MKKFKKIIVLAMATVMLLGATLTANAATCTWTKISSAEYCGICGHACSLYVCTDNGHLHYRCGCYHVRY